MQVEQENDLLENNLYLNKLVKGDGTQDIPYEWDDELDMLAHEEAPSVKMGAIRISNWRCGGEGSDAVTHHKNFSSDSCAQHDYGITSAATCAVHSSPSQPCQLASAKAGSKMPLHDHQACKRMGTRPTTNSVT